MRSKGQREKEERIEENIDDDNKEQEVHKNRSHSKRLVIVAAYYSFYSTRRNDLLPI